MNIKRLKNIVTRHLPTLLRVELSRRFPSTYDLLKIRPTSAWINVTDNCNMRCIMCNQWKNDQKNELSTEEWKSVLDQLASLGVRELCFGGGEPLLVRDLHLLIKHSKSLGIDTGITTSGYLLNERKLEELLEAGVSNVTISIDGVGEGYEKIRRREWKNVLNGAELLSKAKKERGLNVILGFVLMKPTLDNYADVQALAKRLDLPMVVSLVDTTPFLFQLPENSNENWIGPSSVPRLNAVQRQMMDYKEEDTTHSYNSFADIDFFESYFKDPLQKDIPCTVSQVRIMINGMGEVYGGCWSMGAFGSVRDQKLKEIVESKKYVTAHRNMFYKRCPGCSCGYATSNRYDLPMQVKETSYRMFPWLRSRIATARGFAAGAPVTPTTNGTAIPIAEEAKAEAKKDPSLVS